jgi:prepilin-type N-terminal cleavage/methylation domain-containing protein
MTSHKTNRGFTLIELLVVISIISLLSTIVLASLNDARTKATNVAASENARQASLSFVLASSDGNFPDLIGLHCLNLNCTIAGDPSYTQSTGPNGLVAQNNSEDLSKFAHITENLLFAETAEAAVEGLRTPQQTGLVSGLPSGDFQGIFYYTPNDGEDGYLYYPIKDKNATCPSGYKALVGDEANGVLCGQKIGETSQEVFVPDDINGGGY